MNTEIFDKISDGFSKRDPEWIASHCDLPVQFVGDTQTVSVGTQSELLQYLQVTIDRMYAQPLKSLKFVCCQATPVGAALCLCRVEVHLTMQDGGVINTFTETWLLRHTADGDRLVGVFGLRLMDPSEYFS